MNRLTKHLVETITLRGGFGARFQGLPHDALPPRQATFFEFSKAGGYLLFDLHTQLKLSVPVARKLR